MNRREIRRMALGMAPYHGSAQAVIVIGAWVMLVFALLEVPHPWTGFFVGAVPVFLIMAKHHADQEAEWDRMDEEEDCLDQGSES